jgi:hypothetical protein
MNIADSEGARHERATPLGFQTKRFSRQSPHPAASDKSRAGVSGVGPFIWITELHRRIGQGCKFCAKYVPLRFHRESQRKYGRKVVRLGEPEARLL